MPDKKLLRILGLILILAGLALAAGGLATWLSPGNRHHAEDVTRGLWLFKGLLVVHGVFFLFWYRLPHLTSGAALLSPRVLARCGAEPAWARWVAIASCSWWHQLWLRSWRRCGLRDVCLSGS